MHIGGLLVLIGGLLALLSLAERGTTRLGLNWALVVGVVLIAAGVLIGNTTITG